MLGGRVLTDGKQFTCGARRFAFRGVTYGTFRPRDDGARFPSRERIKLDFADIAAAGFTVVRTYTVPPDDLLDVAADWGLRVFVGTHFTDWRYLVGASRRQRSQMLRNARSEIRRVAGSLAHREEVFGLCLANEIPADVVRWVGHRRIGRALTDLADVAHDTDDGHLVTYANYPSAEYLTVDAIDFATFNVFLEDRNDLRRYLTRLQHLAADRPLVLGETGFHAPPGPNGEALQAEALDWQLETALERGVAGTCVFSWTDEWFVGDTPVEGWRFGLTSADRTPRRALAVAQAWNGRTVADLDMAWPSISVVICAYNAAATIAECLEHSTRLDYPDLEILVVDDGSTDGTGEIARRYPRARVLSIDHAGLSVARNEGMTAARGDLVAYLDSDAYPTPEWPYFLALAFDGPTVAGAGGPNVPPRDDPPGALRVAHAPGGPVHVLVGDDRAEHVPGCNMAFWRDLLIETGGFDPVYTAAGDDVDLCWKVLDRGWDIGFHPAALVWHHRRSGLRAYLRQQRGYGLAEALVEARNPDRFTAAGTARWRGHLYTSLGALPGRERIYRGLYGTATYQSVYRGGGHGLDLAHQLGIPAAALLLCLLPLAFLWPAAAAFPALAALGVCALGVIDAARLRVPRGRRVARWWFRLATSALHLLQPLARTWGRVRHRRLARRDLPAVGPLPSPVTTTSGRVLVVPEEQSRSEIAGTVIAGLRAVGFSVAQTTGWEDHDASVLGSALVVGELITSSHPVGWVQIRVRRRVRTLRLTAAASTIVAVAAFSPRAATVGLALVAADVCRGAWRTGLVIRRRIRQLAR